jgi:hypothetical protein
MNVVLAREFRTDVIATLDRRHFRMLHPMTKHEAFRLLPDDIPTALSLRGPEVGGTGGWPALA